MFEKGDTHKEIHTKAGDKGCKYTCTCAGRASPALSSFTNTSVGPLWCGKAQNTVSHWEFALLAHVSSCLPAPPSLPTAHCALSLSFLSKHCTWEVVGKVTLCKPQLRRQWSLKSAMTQRHVFTHINGRMEEQFLCELDVELLVGTFS